MAKDLRPLNRIPYQEGNERNATMKGLMQTWIAIEICASVLACQVGVRSDEKPGDPAGGSYPKQSVNPADAAACRARLRKISEAINAYREERKSLPNWLSDLTSTYIDPKLLVCPYVEKISDLQSWRMGIRGDVFQDPAKSTSYSYEFCNYPLALWTGVRKTWRDYKQRQMEVLGPDVPIVRCFAHDPVLNLAFNGEIYESGKTWESTRYPDFRHEDLHPETLFYQDAPQTRAELLPVRPATLDARFLDLSSHYNAYLDQDWFPFSANNDLRMLPRGLQKLKGVEFDLRGVIQLKGAKLLAPYPIVSPAIRIGRKCGRIHFVHSTVDAFNARIEDGLKIASYVVTYQSGAQAEIPVVYGRDVKNWWCEESFGGEDGSTVAWTGGNPAAADKHQKVRLFLKSWDNPWKDRPIDTVTLVSAMKDTAPFVVAITVE
jgi:hypothetical protein